MNNNEINYSASNDNFSVNDTETRLVEVVKTISCLIGRRLAREYWNNISVANDNKISSDNKIHTSHKSKEES